MGHANSKVSVLVELSVTLPNGETDAQTIRYTFDESKRLTRRDLERHALDAWCVGYEGVELARATEVLYTSVYVVADARALLKNNQRYRIYAKAARWDTEIAKVAEPAGDREEAKSQPFIKQVVSL